MPTLSEALRWAKTELKSYFSIDDSASPQLDAEVLLAHAAELNREYLFAHPEHELNPTQWNLYQYLIHSRLAHVPVSELLHRKEFFGLSFYVDSHVLTPRNETELLVEQALAIASSWNTGTLIDMGTGSGAIIISLAKHLSPKWQFYGIDISADALQVAKRNAKLLSAPHINWIQSDSWENFPPTETFREPVLITANLPYIPETDILPLEVKKYDPASALFAGPDGLAAYRTFFSDLQKQVFHWHTVLFEIDPRQKDFFEKYLQTSFPKYSLSFQKDLADHWRFGILTASKISKT